MKGLLVQWSLSLGFLGLRAFAASPCEACREDATCLGACAYRQLAEAHTPEATRRAYLLLAEAWLKGDLAEGVPRLIYQILKGSKDSIYYHALILLAQSYYKLGQADSAILIYERIRTEALSYPFLRCQANLALGSIYAFRKDLRAIGYSGEALDLAQKLNHPLLLALAYSQVAYEYAEQKNLEQALALTHKAIEAAEQSYTARLYHPLLGGAEKVYTAVLANAASLYGELRRPQEALALYQKAREQALKERDTLSLAQILLGLAVLQYEAGALQAAQALIQEGQSLTKALPSALLREFWRLQAQIYAAQRKYVAALETYEQLLAEVERQAALTYSQRLEQLRLLAGIEQRETAYQQLVARRAQERLFYGLSAGLLLLAIGGLIYAVWQARRRTAEERHFREVIAQQATQIQQQAEALEQGNKMLAELTTELSQALSTLQESNIAARRLQRAMLPALEKILPGSYVYYQPLEEIGGDFYLFVPDPFTQRLLIAVGDCTGHGVSGALLTALFSATIQGIFLQNPSQQPQTLLQRTLQATASFFRTEEAEVKQLLGVKEGADVALLIADLRAQELHFGLAGRPVWIYDPQKGLYELEGGRRGIDSLTPADYTFPTYTETLREDLTLYLFTDGLTDVLSPRHKRLGTRALREFLLSSGILRLPSRVQAQHILEFVRSWRDQAPQNDDITFLILPTSGLIAYASRLA
ncbi:MAG: serine/threonine-protein phosphatase [Bacteroidia bacterium]|nr:serine/threonine-protein phosphatase [Bacteroidia bacterium]MDW8089029.1 PP2C family protein-serine/threonine phosphatase [Bacteroidia bacterium]